MANNPFNANTPGRGPPVYSPGGPVSSAASIPTHLHSVSREPSPAAAERSVQNPIAAPPAPSQPLGSCGSAHNPNPPTIPYNSGTIGGQHALFRPIAPRSSPQDQAPPSFASSQLQTRYVPVPPTNYIPNGLQQGQGAPNVAQSQPQNLFHLQELRQQQHIAHLQRQIQNGYPTAAHLNAQLQQGIRPANVPQRPNLPPLNFFRLFPKLPETVRQRIWSFCNHRRVIYGGNTFKINLFKSTHLLSLTADLKLQYTPPYLHVSREAQAVGLQSYDLIPNPPLPVQLPESRMIYINFEKDMFLCYSYPSKLNYAPTPFYPQISWADDLLKHIKHVVIEYDILLQMFKLKKCEDYPSGLVHGFSRFENLHTLCITHTHMDTTNRPHRRLFFDWDGLFDKLGREGPQCQGVQMRTHLINGKVVRLADNGFKVFTCGLPIDEDWSHLDPVEKCWRTQFGELLGVFAVEGWVVDNDWFGIKQWQGPEIRIGRVCDLYQLRGYPQQRVVEMPEAMMDEPEIPSAYEYPSPGAASRRGLNPWLEDAPSPDFEDEAPVIPDPEKLVTQMTYPPAPAPFAPPASRPILPRPANAPHNGAQRHVNCGTPVRVLQPILPFPGYVPNNGTPNSANNGNIPPSTALTTHMWSSNMYRSPNSIDGGNGGWNSENGRMDTPVANTASVWSPGMYRWCVIGGSWSWVL